jgi:spore maturation protein CgeB
MLSAKPVINGVRSAGNPLDLSGCAITIPPEDPKALAQAIDSLRKIEDAQRAEMGQKGYEYVIQNHEYTVLAQKFIDALSSALPQNKQEG